MGGVGGLQGCLEMLQMTGLLLKTIGVLQKREVALKCFWTWETKGRRPQVGGGGGGGGVIFLLFCHHPQRNRHLLTLIRRVCTN